MRPNTVIWAERLGLAGAAMAAVREVLLWQQRVALDGTALALAFTIGAPLLIAALVLWTTRRGSLVAAGLLAVLCALAWFTSAKIGLLDGSAAFSAGAASLILQTAGLLILLTPSALRWLRTPG